MLKGLKALRELLTGDWNSTRAEQPISAKINTNVNDFFSALFLEGGENLDNDQKAEAIIDFLKAARTLVSEKLPEIPQQTKEEMEQMFIDIALGHPIQNAPRAPHIDNAQLTLAHIHACIENMKNDGTIKIDTRIPVNYKRDNLTILSAVSSNDDLYRRSTRLSEFMNKFTPPAPDAGPQVVK